MKKTTIFAAILAAVLLTGCGEDKPLDNTSSSSSSTASSSSSSSSSIASSSSSSSSSSSTTSSSSTAKSSTSSSSSELVPDWYPGSTTSSTSEPTQSSSTSSTTTTPKPTPSSSTSTSSSFSSQPTTDPVTKYWNPDAPGCTPGPYGGYYDAGGNLHCKLANMPTDEHGAPLISYYDEWGSHYLTYEEMQKYMKETERIDQGGDVDLSDLDWANMRN